MDPVPASTIGLLRAGTAIVLAIAVGAMAWWVMQRPTPQRPRMAWTQHLDDLRRRIFVSLGSILAVTAFTFSFRWPAGSWYPVPALAHNIAAQIFSIIVGDLVPAGVRLVVVRPIDGFVAEMTIAFGLGIIVSAPVVVWQIGGFFTPALEDKERNALRAMLVPILGLFLAGASFAYVYVLPFLLEALYGYGTALGAEPLLQVSELISFTVGLTIIMGLAFQTPLVMWGLTRLGLVPARFWIKYWRHSVVVIFIASAFVSDPTIISMVMVAVPLLVLYGLGIALAIAASRSGRP